MSATDDDEDTCSEDLDEHSDNDSDDDDDEVNDNDKVDGVAGDPEQDQDNNCERLRKSKDTKLVSSCVSSWESRFNQTPVTTVVNGFL